CLCPSTPPSPPVFYTLSLHDALPISLADVIDIVFRARPSAIAIEAANPRHAHEWTLFETVKLPEGKILIPGVIESKSNFIEHPRSEEHTSELQSLAYLVCRLLLEKKK